MIQDPNISEYAKTLGITPDWLKKKMKALSIQGYRDGRSTRLTPEDQLKLRLSMSGSRTATQSPDTRLVEHSSSIATAPVIETTVIEPVPVMNFQPVGFQLDDRSANIELLQSDIGSLHARTTQTFNAFEQSLLANAAQRGTQIGLAVQRTYLGAIDQAAATALGKPAGGSA